MKFFGNVLCFALLCTLAVNSADPEILKTQATACATEGSILELAMSLDPVKILKEIPKVLPCFTACMLRENNIMNQNGKIDNGKFLEVTVNKLGSSFKKDKLSKLVSEQINLANKESDGCAVIKKLLINSIVKSWSLISTFLS